MSSWFDIHTLPLRANEPESDDVLTDAVVSVHEVLESIVDSGIPPDRIVVGGFSQGGAAALVAGLRFRFKLGGIVSISGWWPFRTNTLAEMRHDVPVLLTCGTADPIVLFEMAKLSAEILTESVGRLLSVGSIQRATHPPIRAELDLVECFILKQLGMPYAADEANNA